MHQKILILDFGSQYTQLIARRIRETNVYCELHSYDVSDQFIREFSPQGIILSGGPASVTEEETPRAPQVVFELGVPVLGICYGMQTMAAQLGGTVETSKVREFGYAEIQSQGDSALLEGIHDRSSSQDQRFLDVWMSHGDKVAVMPQGFSVMANNSATPIAAMADEVRRFYGVQFHPEVTHTLQGKAIIERFVHDICGIGFDWNMPDYIDEAIGKIRSQVGKDEVILGLSGGVDSSVAAVLIQRAIGKQLTCVFVDNGLLRLNEAEQVMDTFSKNLGLKVIHIDASAEFLRHLQGVTDPEQKRRIIGRASAKLTKDIQATAVGCVEHAVKHGDVTLADQLVDALGKGLRKASLRAWFEKNAPMFIAKGKDKFSFDPTRKGEWNQDREDTLLATPWEEAKPEEKIVSIFDVSESFDKFMKRVESMSKDAQVTLRNREMIDFLVHASATYHDAIANKARIDTPAA